MKGSGTYKVCGTHETLGDCDFLILLLLLPTADAQSPQRACMPRSRQLLLVARTCSGSTTRFSQSFHHAWYSIT